MSNANKEQMLKHLFDGSDWNVYESKILNLGVGAPGTDLLKNCCDIFHEATVDRLNFEKQSNSSMLFQYGPVSGIFDARSEIANYFSKKYGDEVKSEDLLLTSGATQGLQLILSTVVDFTGYVFVDEVTYMIALDTIKQYTTLNLIPVKLNDDGVDLVHLEQLLKAKQFKSNTKEFWGMYYTIPTYHNPTGILFSEDICKGLIKLAREYDILILCDDVYNILCYKECEASKRLFSYDERKDKSYCGNVISNGSFSKILGPGLRLGWLELPLRVKSVLEKSGILNSGGGLNNYTTGILSSLFKLELAQSHINMMFTAYKERMLATCEVLGNELPKSCNFLPPKGGYFIWISLPFDQDSSDFLNFCMDEEKIYFIPGTRFSLEKQAKNYFRISIAFHNKNKLVDGAKRLCAALKKYLKEN